MAMEESDTNEAVEETEAVEATEESSSGDFPTDYRKLDGLCAAFNTEFKETENFRRGHEDEWIDNLRQVKGVYHPDIIDEINESYSAKSKTYYKYTLSKERALVAKINNIIFPSGAQNWTVAPTPKPKLAPQALNAIVAGLAKQDAQGQPVAPSREDIETAITGFVKDRSDAMGRTMSDQLLNMKYVYKLKNVNKSTVRYGTGVFKGPITTREEHTELSVDESGQYAQQAKELLIPNVENVQIWYFFPDMSTAEFEQCQYVYQLHPMTKHELRELAKEPEFDAEAIYAHIEQVPGGDYKLRKWETDLNQLQQTYNDTRLKQPTQRYEVVERDGYIDGADLLRAGLIGEDDAEREWFVNFWMLGGRCIKATVWPYPITSLVDLFHVCYYRKDESSVFGYGLPVDVRDTATAMCTTVRLMLNNAIKASEPIREVNTDLLVNKQSLPGLLPGELIPREGMSAATASTPLFRDYKTDAHTDLYLALFGKLEQMGDTETGLPKSLYEATSSDETKKAFATRAANVNEVVMDTIKNFDFANEEFLSRLYEWNMVYNPDENIKGDMSVKSIGSTSLLARETQLQGMQMFMQTLQPDDWLYLNRRDLLKEKLRLLDIHQNVQLRSEEEVAKLRQEQAQSEEAQLARAREEADIRYQNSKAQHMEAKSEATVATAPLKKTDVALRVIKTGQEMADAEHRRTMEGHDRILDTLEAVASVEGQPVVPGVLLEGEA